MNKKIKHNVSVINVTNYLDLGTYHGTGKIAIKTKNGEIATLDEIKQMEGVVSVEFVGELYDNEPKYLLITLDRNVIYFENMGIVHNGICDAWHAQHQHYAYCSDLGIMPFNTLLFTHKQK